MHQDQKEWFLKMMKVWLSDIIMMVKMNQELSYEWPSEFGRNRLTNFLKACTLARRTAETFLKYSNRSLQYFTHPNESTFRGPETKVKSKWWTKSQNPARHSSIFFLLSVAYLPGKVAAIHSFLACLTPVTVFLYFLPLNNYHHKSDFLSCVTNLPVRVVVRRKFLQINL